MPPRLLQRALRVSLWALAALALTAGLLYLAYTHRPRPQDTDRPLFRGVTYTLDAEDTPRPT
ncbi:MAG TPA: hypothetical protein VLS89_01135, partial [Candidatus Nanopelagicales bacterium]|nr:hypothetical protein [Candidatus Nanopelagicales bacterium]